MEAKACAVESELRKREQKGGVEVRSDTPGEVSEEVGSTDGRVMFSSLGMEEGRRGSDNRSFYCFRLTAWTQAAANKQESYRMNGQMSESGIRLMKSQSHLGG